MYVGSLAEAVVPSRSALRLALLSETDEARVLLSLGLSMLNSDL